MGQWVNFFTRGFPLVEGAIRHTWPKGATTLRLIDISSVQHPQGAAIDWPQVANVPEMTGVIIKATEGTGYANPFATGDATAARSAGLLVGWYHFCRIDLGNLPEDEARFFVRNTPIQTGDLVALDTEDPPNKFLVGDFSGWTRRWLDTVASLLNCQKVVYSNGPFLERHNILPAVIGTDVWLWLAAYQANPPAPPAGWTQDRFIIWQHTDAASVPGVPTPVDESLTGLTVEQLKALGKGADAMDAEAQQYYFQDGVKVDTSHAVWTVALEPLYAFWRQLVAQGSPLADLVAPGPIVEGEQGATWGGSRPAATVKLQNRIIGAYLAVDGTWHPYQASLN